MSRKIVQASTVIVNDLSCGPYEINTVVADDGSAPWQWHEAAIKAWDLDKEYRE